MPAVLLRILSSLGSLVGLAVNQSVQWVKQEAMRLARAARALIAWSVAFATSTSVLTAAAIAGWEVFAVFVTHSFLVPLTSGVLARLIPPGSRGDGIVWILWDTGLSLKVAWEVFILYLVNYTALWKAFSTWMKAIHVSLFTYRRAMKFADANRQASV